MKYILTSSSTFYQTDMHYYIRQYILLYWNTFLHTAVHSKKAVYHTDIHSYIQQYILSNWYALLHTTVHSIILKYILTYCSTFKESCLSYWYTFLHSDTAVHSKTDDVYHTEIHSYKVQYIGMKTLSFILIFILTYCSTFEWKHCLSYRNTFFIQMRFSWNHFVSYWREQSLTRLFIERYSFQCFVSLTFNLQPNKWWNLKYQWK